MKDFHKKESPFQGITGLAGGATGLRMSSAATKIYGDEVFSTYVYTGTGSAKTITNAIDLDGEGGMTWIKSRASGYHNIIDTSRGKTKILYPNATNGEDTDAGGFLSSFNSNGFSLPSNYFVTNTEDYSSWSFRKAPGFFDIVSWTGDGNGTKTISHSLESIPGALFIKKTSGTDDWCCYHCHGGVAQVSSGEFAYFNQLNSTGAEANATNKVLSTSATQFVIGNHNDVNQNGETYICYVFAGGSSTAANAKSVFFSSSAELTIPDDDAWELGTTFTIEAYIRPNNLDNNYNTIVSQSDGSDNWYFSVLGGGGGNHGKLQFSANSTITTPFQYEVEEAAWTHVAFVSNSGSGQWYVNGTASGSPTSGVNVGSGTGGLKIAEQNNHGFEYSGRISNLRIVKGTAVYTSSFKPATEPLTNITNTVLLCCNDSSTTGSTVTPGTITAVNSPSASTWNPFDDPEGFKFGDGGDQNMIKVGRYLGRGTTLNPVIYLGWEPQFIIIKRLTGASPWLMFDCIRGVFTDGGDSPYLQADSISAEVSNSDYIDVTPTGFKINDDSGSPYPDVNEGWETYSYIAIRRADGWVSKPADAGTDVFGVDVADGSTNPSFISNFPVDFSFYKQPASADSWYTGARLIGTKYLKTESTGAQSSSANFTWDYSDGWRTTGLSSSWQSWMWKRGPGFDAVAYEGNSQSTRIVRHSLGAAPDMIWVKNRDTSTNWLVGHHGLDDGTSPWTHYIYLNDTAAEGEYDFFANKAPTAYSFEVSTAIGNDTNNSYLALLFKSITGISKCGNYTGNGGSSTLTITTGFQPRFIFIKRTDGSGSWGVHDTTRGWGTANGPYLRFNNNNAEVDIDIGAPISTGFTLTTSHSSYNYNGSKYIYYAHA